MRAGFRWENIREKNGRNRRRWKDNTKIKVQEVGLVWLQDGNR